ncbi:nucleotidyltransferase family protein [Geobacter sp.]|uniref:nucleotidyltransferase family protein n=1 Tax=Geobacter sp. TaxID=46610 RepID=UPI0027BAD27B|nr:nucleotidyltransferase family protein [Geobacter sp.]
MNRWKEVLIKPTIPVLKAIEIIDASSLQIALVVDERNLLLGTLTDGDVRRAILKGVSLNEPVQSIMFREPTIVSLAEGREKILALMKEKQLRQIPVLDENGCVIGLEVWDELIDITRRDNWVVLMAGGLGTRLGALTKDCPKPLLKIGNKPILETILESCKEFGFHKFFIAVNYKAEMVREYFGDGSRFGVEIRYLHEAKRLGTAGALALLPETPLQPILVLNGDVLTKVNFKQLFDFHTDYKAAATMCVREYDFQVPYGVVNIDRHRLTGIEEKPIQRFFVNAGLYVLNPECLELIPREEYFDMPTLFENLIAQNIETAAFPVREYWLDIGRVDDYERANGEFPEVFA